MMLTKLEKLCLAIMIIGAPYVTESYFATIACSVAFIAFVLFLD